MSSGDGDMLVLTTKKKKKRKKKSPVKVVTNCSGKQSAKFLEEPNLSAPIKVIGAQRSGPVAQ